MKKKVLVSGCFDLLHAGHIAFFEEASQFGDLYVCAGADDNIQHLKGKPPMFSQEERVYVLSSVKSIHHARVSSGKGMLDFEPDIAEIKPDYFVVNEDGHTEGKETLCKKHGVEYKVLSRIPAKNFKPRSSSSTKSGMKLPYRMCLAGGWLDQQWVSRVHPGSVVVVGLEPIIDFNDRSGMATSSRKKAKEIWGNSFPPGNYEKIAKMLFAYENPPGVTYVSGSQDAIGLVFPGVNRLDYNGSYWPHYIESCNNPEIIHWLQSVIHFVPLAPRPDNYDPLVEKHLSPENVKLLGNSGVDCYDAIVNKDLAKLGRSLSATVEGWRRILPLTVNKHIEARLAEYADHPGAVFSGCGGGYIIVASDKPVKDGIPVVIRNIEL